MNLNFQPHWFPPEHPGLPSLQFVAKAHEMLMQASILTIALAYIRHELVSARRMPFGALFSALQTCQLSYLWSMEFWATLSANCLRGRRKVFFMLLIPTSILLAAAVGPSSAMAMIPRRSAFHISRVRWYGTWLKKIYFQINSPGTSLIHFAPRKAVMKVHIVLQGITTGLTRKCTGQTPRTRIGHGSPLCLILQRAGPTDISSSLGSGTKLGLSFVEQWPRSSKPLFQPVLPITPRIGETSLLPQKQSSRT